MEAVLTRGDHDKIIRIVDEGVVQSLAAYDSVRLTLLSKGDNLVQKYSSKAADQAADYEACSLLADSVEFTIRREDIDGLKGSDELSLIALFGFDRVGMLDDRFIDPYRVSVGPVCALSDKAEYDGQ